MLPLIFSLFICDTGIKTEPSCSTRERQLGCLCRCAWGKASPIGLRAALQIQSCRISKIQDNNRITRRIPGEDPVLTLSQKPEALKQTSDSLQQALASEDCVGAGWHTEDSVDAGYTVNTGWHTAASSVKCFLCFVYLFFKFLFFFSFLRGCVTRVEGRYIGMGSWMGLGYMIWTSQRVNKS